MSMDPAGALFTAVKTAGQKHRSNKKAPAGSMDF